ncbi:pyridoxamine 5-phosphate oxidase [Azospirillum thiophilum]|uniref:Pyridoxamine 5-phosphate oxidase n=1 Tax=Azospirillum thiophilum TaxID=528244 RepID=A0AAC8ZWT1_9PROT|nr:DegT/DnrJ/EryC1/StrS family aminotransferase [Azospirillum thiophilum]ALG75550.1 pyridoxamine 5-phosphate oxidase [Azospirillum thiophilum]KJR62070.1 pyridoxamine 5-phosphate oxidase [Azospirillum thiophilum]
MFYELAAPTWGEEEVEAIQRVVKSGRFTMGENVAAFEAAFASYFGAKYAVMVNSGSSANLVAVAALFYKKERPLQRGDEVIVPAISWATTYHPLQQYGLKLKFIDVELDTLNMDVSKLEQALTPRTRAIMAVSILGNPAALDVMRRFADEHGLYFIEDNCESMDAELGGKKTGTFGDLNTFSFFFSHHISTMEGGMVLTDDLELYHLVKAMRAHGWTRDLPHDTPLYQRGGNDHFEAYRFILPGYNVRPLEMEGAVGLEQLKKLPAFTEARRKNLALFQSLFAGDERFIIQRENGKSSAFSFTIILNPKRPQDRKAVFAALTEADIGFRIITGGCFLRHDVIKHYDYEVVGGVENANLAHDQGFFVGNHPFPLDEQITRLHKVLDAACR